MKYRLWKRYLQSSDGRVYSEYCKCRNQLRRLTRKAVKDQEREIAKKAKSDPKAFWSFVNRKTKLKSAIPDLLKPDGSMTANDAEKANVLGEFYSSVFVKEPSEPDHHLLCQNVATKAKLEITLTEEIVLERLKKLDQNKSPGPDLLHPRLLKELSPVLSKPLFIIFSESLKLGRVPSAWKMANITAIYKNKGNKNSAENYRPVLTSIVSKVMESILRDSILGYLKENNLLSEKQLGFLNGRSTTLQLLHLIEKLSDVADRSGVINVIYCEYY